VGWQRRGIVTDALETTWSVIGRGELDPPAARIEATKG
jgi:hypothetical protein